MKFRTTIACGLAIAALGASFHAIAQERNQAEQLLFGDTSDPSGGSLVQAPVPSGAIRADLTKVKCIHKIEIAAQADGLIKSLEVQEGSVVKKDDRLLTIDYRVAEAELEVAQRKLEAADMQAKQTANVEFNEAARDLAKEEYSAELQLYEGDNTTYSALKRKRLEAQKAIFSVDLAKVELEKEKLAAKIASQERDAAQVRLDLYEVVAPYDGIIVERKRDLGEWIRAGEPVLRLVHMNEMKITGYVRISGPNNSVSINDLVDASVKIRVRINPQQNAEYEAKVDFVSPEIDSGQVRFIIRIKNQKDMNGEWILRDGMDAVVDIFPQNR